MSVRQPKMPSPHAALFKEAAGSPLAQVPRRKNLQSSKCAMDIPDVSKTLCKTGKSHAGGACIREFL